MWAFFAYKWIAFVCLLAVGLQRPKLEHPEDEIISKSDEIHTEKFHLKFNKGARLKFRLATNLRAFS